MADEGLVAEVEALQEILQSAWVGAYISTRGPGSYDIPWAEAAAYARERAGWLIKEINGVSAEAVQKELRRNLPDLFEGGTLTTGQMRQRLIDAFTGMTASRAAMIVRTEIGWASGKASSSAWREAGVQYVSISDGLDFDPPCVEADGKIVPLEWYEANILEHPNCTRAASPLSAEEVNPADVSTPY